MNYETPCIEAVVETFSSMCGVTPEKSGESTVIAGSQTIKTDDIIGIVGLTGDRKGDIIITSEAKVAQKVVGALLMDEITEINSDLLDGFGEIINIIAGAFTGKIIGVKFNLALPTVMAGEHQTHIREGIKCLCIPMQFPEWGKFRIMLMMEDI